MKDWVGSYNSIYKTLGASNHTDKERETNDYYATDPVAIDKLLSVEQPNKHIWECACGGGHLAQRLKDKGFEVFCTDLVYRGYPLDDQKDFLKSNPANTVWNYGDYDIVTNPPYKFAKEFVLKALEIVDDGHKIYMFLKLTFLEGKARLKELFSKYPPKTIYVFSERVMCAKNGSFEEMKSSGGSAVSYGWFVWEKGYNGDTIVKWI